MNPLLFEILVIIMTFLVLVPSLALILKFACRQIQLKDTSYLTALKVVAITIAADTLLSIPLALIPPGFAHRIIGLALSIGIFIFVTKKIYKIDTNKSTSLLAYYLLFTLLAGLILIALALIVYFIVGSFAGGFISPYQIEFGKTTYTQNIDSVKTYTLNDIEYEVKIVEFDFESEKASFNVNGEMINNLEVGEEKPLASGLKLGLESIQSKEDKFYVEIYFVGE